MTSTAAGQPALIDQLRNVLGTAHVLTEAHDVDPFVVDWRGRYRGEVQCVALPCTTDEVARVVQLCRAAGVAVIAQGGNTGLQAGAVPVGASVAAGSAPVLIGLRRMNRIREVDPLGNTIVAEAGCILATVQQTAEQHDRIYGVSLGAQGSCQIGGNISTNAGGTGVLKYGSTRDQVIGLEVVLPDGQIWNGLRALHKDNTGYAMKHLFIGAEGTLGIVTAATLRLHPRPKVWAAAWMTLDTVQQALECLAMLTSIAGDRVCAYELLSRLQMETVIEHFPELRLPTDSQAPYAVLVELSDTYAKADLSALLEDALGEFAERGWIRDAAIAASLAQLESFWAIRHNIAEANRKWGMGIACDVAVPVKAVPEFIERATAAVQAHMPELQVVLVAHLGDGNIHFTPRMSFERWRSFEAPFAVADSIRSIAHDVAVSLDGTFSAEHGIGHVLTDEFLRLRSPVEVDLMKQVRRAIDPEQAMNPGKIFGPDSQAAQVQAS